MVSPTFHQSFQGMPKLDTALVNPDGTASLAWYRFLISLFNRSGSSIVPFAQVGILSNNGDGTASVLNPNGGSPASAISLGTVILDQTPGGPAKPQALGASPFIFTCSIALGPGTLVIFSAELELSRDGGIVWYKVSLTGGAVPLLVGDKVRATWFSAVPPLVTFFPNMP